MEKILNFTFLKDTTITQILPKVFVFVFLICFSNLNSQILNNFSIADSGSVPSINSDLNGGIFVSWQKLNDAIYLTRIGADGNEIGNKIKFSNTYASITPRISVNSRNILVVWNNKLSNIVNPFQSFIIGNISPKNTLDTNAYLMFNNNPADDDMRGHPNVSFLDDTLFIVVWNGNGDSTMNNYGIYGQLATTNVVKKGNNFLITDHYKSNIENYYPKIINLKQDKYFLVTWEDNSSGRFNIYGRKFNLNGTPIGSSFLISDDSAMTYMFYYSMAKDTAGNFVVVWFADKGEKSQMEWRWYNNDGSPSTNVEQLTQLDFVFSSGSTIDASINKDGKTIIEWEQFDSNQIKIYGQRFLADRSKLGTPFRVSTNNTSTNEIYANVVLSNDTIYSVWQEGNGIEGNILDFNDITAVNKNDGKVNQITTYTLFQNYPNPFNPSTTIHYQIPKNGMITIKVYDLLGREIKSLVNQYQNRGSYNINFDASVLASGVYVYQLRSGKFIVNKKLLFLK